MVKRIFRGVYAPFLVIPCACLYWGVFWAVGAWLGLM